MQKGQFCDKEKPFKQLNCNFTTSLPYLPIRTVSFFVRTQYLDDKLPEQLKWDKRFKVIKQLIEKISADIILLQGLNLLQCKQMSSFLKNKGFFCHFVASHSGKSFRECNSVEYNGSFNGICFLKSKFKLIQTDGFWLKEEPNVQPSIDKDDQMNRLPVDQGGIDKSFGCTHSYRYCVVAEICHYQSNKKIIVSCTHFPIGSDKARVKSSELIKNRFKDVEYFIFGGSLMLFPDKDGDEAYSVLKSFASDYRCSKYHYGHNTSFIGYQNDEFKIKIFPEGFTESRNLDLIFQRGFVCERSFSLSGEFRKDGKLLEPLTLPIQCNDEDLRLFASDRCLIGCDLKIDPNFSSKTPSFFELNNKHFFNFTRNLTHPTIRVINWNLKTSYHDNIQSIDNPNRIWPNRFIFVQQAIREIQPDILLLQEMSPNQAHDMKTFLKSTNYKVFFRCTHSGHDIDEIQPGEWTGAIMAIAFSNRRFLLISHGGFWLKEDCMIAPPQIPDSLENRKPIEQGGTNKCFGDTHSYRSCQWIHIKDNVTNQTILVVCSDFPHQSKNGAQIKCAELCVNFIDNFSADRKIFGGEICTFQDESEIADKTLSIFGCLNHWLESENGHYGHQTTFVGYQNDKFFAHISQNGIIEPRNIDILLQKGFKNLNSFSCLIEFDASCQKLLPLVSPVFDNKMRSFASDHLLIGFDLV